MTAPNLAAWLLERLAEDEAGFHADAEAEAESVRHDGIPDMTREEVEELWLSRSEDGREITHWPRVLRQVEAHRRIVERYAYLIEWGSTGDAEWVLRALASIYADHEGYRAEWAL